MERSQFESQARTIAVDLMKEPVVESRLLSILLTLAVLLGGYALLILGLHLSEPAMVAGYLVGIGILSFCWVKYGKNLGILQESLVRERSLLIAGIVLLALTYPFLADNPYQVHVMAMGGILALMALGLNINIGYAGLADFGYIAYYAIGAYASALFSIRFGINFWLCLPLAGMVAGVLSLLVSFPALRVKGHYLALVTLGFAFVVIQLITNLEGLTGGTQGLSGIVPPSLFGHSFRTPLQIGSITLPYQANFYFLVLFFVTGAAILCNQLSRSRWGRAWTAMHADDVAAESSGLNLVKLKLLAFGTGASLGGVAGSLYAHMIGYIDPSSFRFIESVFLLAIVVLGNFRIAGVILAAMLFTIFPEKMRAYDDWRLLIFGLALLTIMLVRGRRMASKSY